MTWFAVIYTNEAIEDLDIGVTTKTDERGVRRTLWNDMIMRDRDSLRKGAKDDTHGSFPELNKYIVSKGTDLEIVRFAKDYLRASEGIYMIVFGMDGDIYDEDFREFSEMETVIIDVNDVIETDPLKFASGEEIVFKAYTIFKFIDGSKC